MVEKRALINENEHKVQETENRKPYHKPQIIHELELEIRTGSPINIPDALDPFSNE